MKDDTKISQKARLKEIGKTILYGHQKRKVHRIQKHRQKSHLVILLCQKHWQDFLVKNKDTAITDEQIIYLYDEILSGILSSFNVSNINNALMQRYRFFKKVSDERIRKNLSPLILPVIAYQPKRPSNTNSLNAFLYLPIAQKIIEDATTIWRTQNHFDKLDAMAWLIFSLIVYGGYSDNKVIRTVYEGICTQDNIYQLPNGYAVLCATISNPSYGRRAKGDEMICYSRWVVFDDVSLLWLGYISRYFVKEVADKSNADIYPSFDKVISRLGDFIDENINDDKLASSQFYKHINLYHQLLPQTRIDQQMITVLMGKQQNTAISEEALLDFFAPVRLPKAHLGDDFYQSRHIIASMMVYAESSQKQGLYKDDIVVCLRSIIKQKPQTHIHTDLTELYNKPMATNQKRLVKWVIMLYEHKNKSATIQRYLSEIAQIFLSLTHEMNFVDWGSEDYEDLYEKIIALKNPTKPAYTQTVIKSLHGCFVRYYNAPVITIAGEHDALIVTDRLISPALYQELFNSIDKQIYLSDYHKDLLVTIFTLLYRTGMRISELLGVRTADIECPNDNTDYCAIIVRPNRYRSLKSDDGARRLVPSTLLKPKECQIFLNLWINKKRQNSI